MSPINRIRSLTSRLTTRTLTLAPSSIPRSSIRTMGSKAETPSITADQWLAAASHRRTVYGLASASSVSDDRVKEIVEKVLSFAPSSYNSQPVRTNLLFGEKHKQFWDIVLKEAEPILKAAGEEVWNGMKGFFGMHKAAYGTVVFWDRGQTTKDLQSTHPSTAAIFPQYAEHANGIHQILVWTALELEGLGANLQHVQSLGPVVEAALRKFCGVTDDYSLKAQLTYGDETKEHPAKPEKLPFEETVKVL